jgi:pimeloyl-ACP methyl ester carboxylesterase
VHLELPARIGDGESPGDGVRGVALHLVSLGNTGFEREVMDELRNRGWAVLRFVPDPFTLRVLAVDRAAPEDPDRMQVVAADDLARQVDDQHAALAEAVGGMLAHLRDARPDVRPDRMAIVGFSLGALAAPAVALRLESVTDALVLVGGGADISTILIRGSLTRFDRAVRGEVRRTLLELPESYRKAAQLDGYNVGPLIRHIPTLIVHASFDAIVPSATGDLLYEQLGRPERWSYPFGHLGLFWWLPNEADEIADWVERATQRAELNERDDERRSTRER